MGTSTEQQIDGCIIDVHDLPPAAVIGLGDSALDLALLAQLRGLDRGADDFDAVPERVSAFANYI